MSRGDGARRGLRHLARVLVALNEKPRDANALKVHFGLARADGLAMFLRWMHARERLHIAGWRAWENREATPIWAYGKGVDAPQPPMQNGRLPARPRPELRVRADAAAMAALLDALQCTDTAAGLMVQTGLSDNTLYGVLRDLRPLVHILEWHRPIGGSHYVAVWCLGEGEDKAAPRRDGNRQAVRRFRAREKERKTLHLNRIERAVFAPMLLAA